MGGSGVCPFCINYRSSPQNTFGPGEEAEGERVIILPQNGKLEIIESKITEISSRCSVCVCVCVCQYCI